MFRGLVCTKSVSRLHFTTHFSDTLASNNTIALFYHGRLASETCRAVRYVSVRALHTQEAREGGRETPRKEESEEVSMQCQCQKRYWQFHPVDGRGAKTHQGPNDSQNVCMYITPLPHPPSTTPTPTCCLSAPRTPRQPSLPPHPRPPPSRRVPHHPFYESLPGSD